ncbi:hypothetical protein [Leifsonia sp. A12D58]|uniref:hypothetical protein n=1 Tax=Leifsonia sp. A12D58 TaxID=3397674 RepID=UPI0039E1B84B
MQLTTGMGKGFIAVAATMTLAAAMALTGCVASDPAPTNTGQAQDASSPRPIPSSTASAIPVPSGAQRAYEAVTQIIVRPEILELKDSSGADVATLSYDAAAEEFVGLFTEILDADPVVTEFPGGLETLPTTRYAWTGFELMDDHEHGDAQSDMNVSVKFTAPELGARGITVSTIQGFKPGDDLRWLATYMDEPYYDDSEYQQIQAEHGPPIGEQEISGYSNSHSVAGRTNYPEGGTAIYAPWNFGIGHV